MQDQNPGPQSPCSDSLQADCNTQNPQQGGDFDPTGGRYPMSRSQLNQQSRPTSDNSLYVDRAGNDSDRTRNRRIADENIERDPITDLQRLAHASLGEWLPIFGRDLFRATPSTFAPGDQIAVAPDYVVGPGDEILLRIWGSETFNGQLTVDRAGSIYIPKVGSVQVGGLRFDDLRGQITTELGRTLRNFDVSVNIGRLRSIQVYVVGEARHPGAYTVSSLSTVLNALLASGGPNVQGSLRHVQLRRTGQPVSEFDLYDLVLRGDKSKDLRLQTGDTIFIPAVGPQVALGGSVRHPGIYELSAETTLQDLLDLAGGLSPTASRTRLRLERIQDDRSRKAMNVALDAPGRAMLLRDGDVLYADHISAAYDQTVAIRGNLANPGRFAWHEGMKLSDIIPDRMSLLTTGYWDARNRLGAPVPLFQPAPQQRVGQAIDPALEQGDEQRPVGYTRYDRTNASDDTLQSGRNLLSDSTAQPAPGSQTPQDVADLELERDSRNGRAPQTNASSSSLAGTSVQQQRDPRQGPPEKRNLITIPAPEIDWSYAVIERLNPATLKNQLIPFNLGRLVQDHDASQDLELRPGDIVTILSQHDVLVPQEMQTKYIRLEGEFAASGVYSVRPNETLADVVRRAGGLTPNAYLYGSDFIRESARAFQQQRLDEYVASLSANMERAAAERTVASTTGTTDPTALSEERLLVNQLRQLRATGRVVLEFTPSSRGLDAIPRVPLEDGDVFRVPATPNTISVVGAVYGQNVFLYNPSRRLSDYVALAGRPNRIADRKHAFIIRADGSIFSRQQAHGTLSNNFESTKINPGDSIVIPEKLIKPPVLHELIEYSQILSSFGLAAAAINVVR
jgi:protein involved in polysaccharide export with SLBB domain